MKIPRPIRERSTTALLGRRPFGRRPLPDGRVRVVPSLLAADPADLRGDLAAMAAAGARWASVDVMDGHFVPNLSFGPDLIRSLKRDNRVRLDAHLMVDDPAVLAPAFAEAGADWVIFHLEACARPGALLRALRDQGVGTGLAVKPGTPAARLLPFLKEVDLVLVMTVEPGFGGQRFLPAMLPKLRTLRAAIARSGRRVWLQVDGGIDAASAPLAAEAGADSLVAGSAVFRAGNPAAALRALETSAQRAFLRSTGGATCR